MSRGFKIFLWVFAAAMLWITVTDLLAVFVFKIHPK
jgi:hypothetical protein